jgi:hypothetical protein
MANRSSRNKGADLADVGDLHALLVTAAKEELQRAIDKGEVTPALISATLKVCSEAGVAGQLGGEEELFSLNSMLSTLNLKEVTMHRH